MTTPLCLRFGVDQDLPEVISFYEDVTKQMKTAYNDLYETLIDVSERFNATVQTLEVANREREKLLKENEYLIKEMEKEPINLGSTHILHNILCDKAEAYKILKVHDDQEKAKRNFDSRLDRNDKDTEKDKHSDHNIDEEKYTNEIEKTLEGEIQLNRDVSQIEDLLNKWKQKFKNPIINVMLNVTPVSKETTKYKSLGNKNNFKSWQDELKYYVNRKNTEDLEVTNDELKNVEERKEQTETNGKVAPFKEKELEKSNEWGKRNPHFESSQKIEMHNTPNSEKIKQEETNEKERSHEATDENYFPHTKNINSSKKTYSLENYEELHFSDNSENFSENGVNKLSKENKMLNAILSQKKKMYAQIFENHARGSNYEVFHNLQSMEHIENVHSMRLGDMANGSDVNLLQQSQEQKFSEMKPLSSNNPYLSLSNVTTANSNILNSNSGAIQGNENDEEIKSNEAVALHPKHTHQWTQNKRTKNLELTSEQKRAKCFLPNHPDEGNLSMASNVEIDKNKNAHINTTLKDIRINYDMERKLHRNFIPQSNGLSYVTDNIASVISNSKDSHTNEVALFPKYDSAHNTINQCSGSNLGAVNGIPHMLNPSLSQGPSMYSRNCRCMDFSNASYPHFIKPSKYYAHMNKQNAPFGPNYHGNGNNACTCVHNNMFNSMGTCTNGVNHRTWCYSNGFTNNMQNWHKNSTHEFANDGDTILYASASAYEPCNAYLQESGETIKQNFAQNCNTFPEVLRFPRGNGENYVNQRNLFYNSVSNAYEANKMLCNRPSRLIGDMTNQVNATEGGQTEVIAEEVNEMKIVKKRETTHIKKNERNRTRRKNRSRRKKQNRKQYIIHSNKNIGNMDGEAGSDEYTDGKYHDSDSRSNFRSDVDADTETDTDTDSLFNSLCKTVNYQNIQSNELTSNYIDMDFDKHLLPYYMMNDGIDHLPSIEDDVSEYHTYHDNNEAVIHKSNEKKRKKEEESDSSRKKGRGMSSNVSNRSYSSDVFVSLNSCNGTNEVNSSRETYKSNSVSNVGSDTETETTIKTAGDCYNQMNLSNNTKRGEVHQTKLGTKGENQCTYMPSNNISCVSVCGSYSREEEIKKIITEQERNAERETVKKAEKQSQKRNNTQQRKSGHKKLVLKPMKPIKSVKPVRETSRKQTTKSSKRIETTIPSRKEEMEKMEKKAKKKEITVSFQEKTEEITNEKNRNQLAVPGNNENAQTNIYGYTSNDASLRANLETIISKYVETTDEASNTKNWENVRTDRYELRAQKKITYVLPSIKRKLRRDSARRIFDPFLYNTMWKVSK